MPQGLTNAPATFQRLIDNTLLDLKLTYVLIYLDDINIFSKTFDKHFCHLKEVFKCLLNANLKLKPKKCYFFKYKIEFLGFKVIQEGLGPMPHKIEAVEKMSLP